jgi:methionyl aminopeptidase
MINLKSKDDIEGIRKAGKIARSVLDELANITKPGLSTKRYNEVAEKITLSMNAKPAFKGYNGFPHAVCVSLNEEVVHGFPSDRKLKDGDIVSLDFGSFYDGYYADAAVTIGVGNISDKAAELINVTKEALYKGISMAKVGNKLEDISFAIENYVTAHNFSVVRDFVGHGVGFKLHEEPQVPNYVIKDYNILLEDGIVIAIEPMVNELGYKVKIKKNKWTVVTADKGLSAHFEQTVAVTKEGTYILT